MTPRIQMSALNQQVIQHLQAVEAAIVQSGLEPKLLHLMKFRASQINGCAYCLDMHSKEARRAGESEQRLYGLDAWHEAPYYSERERAALEWTEAITHVADGHVPDSAYEAVKAQFTENEIANLTLAAAMINTWNRLTIALRVEAGSYRVGMYKQAAELR
jgi:AhpD family alkylhydroperoxidase